VTRVEFGWIIWVALLIVWTVVALIVAYLFGGWARRGEASQGKIVSSEVHYLRRRKRTSGVHRTPTDKPRRIAGGQHRH
jgi:hypothetical protein